MKTVEVNRDFTYKVRNTFQIAYRAGVTYQRVPEAQVRAILRAGAGKIAQQEEMSE